MKFLLDILKNWWTSGRWKVSLSYAFVSIMAIIVMTMFICFIAHRSKMEDMGIYPTLNGQAVLICGEAITINVPSNRSDYEIKTDFNLLLAKRAIECGPKKADVK